MNYLKVKDSNLVRDPYSKAILNLDRSAIARNREQRLLAEQRANEFKNTGERLNMLEQELCEIKSLLKQLVEKQ